MIMVSKRIDLETVFQMETAECGVASLSMVLSHFEIYVPLETLRVECNVSRDGSNAFNLIKAAQKYGLFAQGLRLSAQDLQKIEAPAILVWNQFHFIVYEGWSKTRVYVNDPALGKRSFSFEEFAKGFSGVAIEFKKTKELKKQGTKPLSLFQIAAQYLKNAPQAVTFLLLTSASLMIPGFALPAFLLVFIDVYFSAFHLPWIWQFLSLVSMTAFFSGILVWMQLYFLSRLNVKLSLSLSSGFLWKLLRLPIHYFQSRRAGQILFFMGLNQSVAEVLTGSVIFLLIHILFFLFFAFAMFAYDSTIAWIGIAVGAINLSTMYFIYRFKSDEESRYQIQRAMYYGISVAGLSNMDFLKTRGGESGFFSLWATIFSKNLNGFQKLEQKNLLLFVLPAFFQMLAWAALLGIGSIRIIQGDLTAGKLMALGLLQVSFLIPINRFIEYSPQILSLKKNIQCLNDISNQAEDKIFSGSSDKMDRQKLSGKVEFQNVTYRFSPQTEPIVKDLSFKVEPGQKIAFVGPNGSGKSTVARLAAGLYHPETGSILYDGIPIEKIPPDLFRSSIGHIDQDPFLFAGTIRENISLWQHDASDHAMMAAAQTAQIHEKIALRDGGYDAFVAEQGSNFSAGERQQLQLAQSLFHNPTLLIFDKALSFLDEQTKKMVAKRVEETGATVIMVVDRTHLLRLCDQIYVLDGKGAVIQTGTHEQLKNVEGWYQEFCKDEGKDG